MEGAWGRGADQTGPRGSVGFSPGDAGEPGKSFQRVGRTWADVGLGKFCPALVRRPGPQHPAGAFVRDLDQPFQERQTDEETGGRKTQRMFTEHPGKAGRPGVFLFCLQCREGPAWV